MMNTVRSEPREKPNDRTVQVTVRKDGFISVPADVAGEKCCLRWRARDGVGDIILENGPVNGSATNRKKKF